MRLPSTFLPRSFLRPAYGFSRFQEADEITDRPVAVPGMAERQLPVNFVAVAASVASLRQVAGLFEVVDDMRRGSFGNPDADGDVSEPRAGIGGDAFEHVGVVRDEPPEVLVSGT